jgi:hypothetical protein
MGKATGRPTVRQRECFEVYAQLGDSEAAARRLAISVGSLKRNLGEYYRRVNANSGVQAAYLTWGPGRTSD